jgi:hypothetical protein
MTQEEIYGTFHLVIIFEHRSCRGNNSRPGGAFIGYKQPQPWIRKIGFFVARQHGGHFCRFGPGGIRIGRCAANFSAVVCNLKNIGGLLSDLSWHPSMAECPLDRNLYLTGAQELRSGKSGPSPDPAKSWEVMARMPIENFLVAMAATLDGPAAEGKSATCSATKSG